MSDRLQPALLLEAYALGYFPMADARGRIQWYRPDPRTVIFPDRFHVPHNLRKVIRRGVFEVRINTAFEEVMRACADRSGGSWIDSNILESYVALHRLGYAHSVECWRDGGLAGGLYGVALGGAFFGESMFHRVSEASKVALASLMGRLRDRGFAFCDTQWNTSHLRWMGAVDIRRSDYLEQLTEAIRRPVQFTDPA